MATGSIRERRKGVWEVRVYVGRDANGKVRHKSVTVHGGKRKAEDARRKLMAEVKAGQHSLAQGTVANLLERHMEMLRRKNRSASTLRAYRYNIDANIVPALGGTLVCDLKPQQLDSFYDDLERAGLKPSTIRQHHAIISGALRQAEKWGEVPANVAKRATPPEREDSEVVAPTVAQVRRLVELAEERNPTLGALLLCAATTGARRGELCALRWSNVNLDEGWMLISEGAIEPGKGQVQVKGTKSRKAGRIAVDEFTVSILAAHRQRVMAAAAEANKVLRADAFVFSERLDGSAPYKPAKVTAFFARLRQAANCPTVKLHHLRHFVATHAMSSGADVRTVAGRLRHDANMTLRVYSHLLEERDRKVADHMGQLLRPREESE